MERIRVRSREQAVSLVELFYDLVFVYAISRVTGIFDGGRLTPLGFGQYFIASLVVLQAWMYMTNYINRFGRERVYENAAIVVNMCAAVVMSNTVGLSWTNSLAAPNLSLFMMLGTVLVLYALRLREGPSQRQLAVYSLKTLVPVCMVYLLVGLTPGFMHPLVGLALDVVAIFWGIFGPAIIAPNYKLDLSYISFPHLAERFELVTIITFGEAIITVANVFELEGLGFPSLATFFIVVGMFGCYVLMMHVHADHRWQHRGLHLIYCHFFIVLAINLFTVCLNILAENPVPTPGVCATAVITQSLFYICLALLEFYHKDEIVFTTRDRVLCTSLVLTDCLLIILSAWFGVELFLVGPLIAAAGNFWVFYNKGLACTE